jgi:DNA-binding CsgD family transcriptional regulator/tetratricopeptide (TPR) repeat protein
VENRLRAERALWIARTSTHAEISAALALAPRRSIENAILRSFVAGEPEVSQTLDVMMRALTKQDEDAPHLADRVIAMLLRRNHLRRARAVIDAVPDVPTSLRPLRDAHIAVIAAREGSDSLAYDALARAEPQEEEDELLTGLLKHRAAQAYLLLGRYDLAMRRGLSAVLHFERTNAKLLAAHALRTAMRIAHLVRADVTTAREYAERGLRLALEHGFSNFAAEARSRLLLYAAELGDEARYTRLERETPAHFFETIVARAVHTIGSGDIAQARQDLARGRVRALRSPERLLCDALSAVCAFVLSDAMPAKTVVEALLADPPFPRDAVQRRFTIVAHGIGTSLAIALDRSEDARLIGARLQGLMEETLVDYALGRATSVPPALRGYATIIDVVRHAKEPAHAIHLTDAERRLIPMLSEGKDVGRIARETMRSAATIRTHLEHIREKLGVARSEDVPQRARELGIA